MSHKSGHIIVNIATPVEVAKIKTRGGIVAAVLVLVGIVAGALLF